MTSRGSSLILQTLFDDLDVHPSWQLDSNSDMTTHIPYIYNVGCGNHGLTMVNYGSSALTVVNPSPQTHQVWYKMVDQPSIIGALRHWLYLYHMTVALQVPIFWQEITDVEALGSPNVTTPGAEEMPSRRRIKIAWSGVTIKYVDENGGISIKNGGITWYNNPKSGYNGITNNNGYKTNRINPSQDFEQRNFRDSFTWRTIPLRMWKNWGCCYGEFSDLLYGIMW